VRYARTAVAPASPLAAGGRRPADEDIFADAAQDAPTPRPLVKPAEAVSVAELAPLPSARSSASASGPAVAAFHGDGFHEISPAGAFRIQAGAFGDQDNARKAVAQLAATGAATIEPIERGGQTLYRVTLPGPADEAEAYALRDKLAGIGFADARVVRP
jgi:rare lipoprotein A